MAEILTQNEIDNLIGKYSSTGNLPSLPAVPVAPVIPTKGDYSNTRYYCYYTPIFYFGETQPSNFRLETIYERYNKDRQIWEFWFKTEKLFK